MNVWCGGGSKSLDCDDVICGPPLALLNAGANIEIRATESIQNERGYAEEKSETALHVAVSSNQIETCILLLAKGADINAIEYHLDSKMMDDVVRGHP